MMERKQNHDTAEGAAVENSTGHGSRPPLLPVRHPNPDFFICDVFDAIPKDDMASMEHPVFSLSTKPDTRLRRYEHNGTVVEIVPSGIGLATIHDKDILIYCISQLIAKINRNETPQRVLRLQAYDFMVASNRETSGDGYRRLKEALTRLRGTTIVTNISTNESQQTHGFGLIEEFRMLKKNFDGRMTELEITLSEWVFNAVLGREVLTIHPDYFRLRKPIERRMYELARKHCGRKEQWSIGLALLQKKCGSNSPLRVFRSLVRKVADHDGEHHHFPDYSVDLDDDQVVFRNRKTMPALNGPAADVCRPLDLEVFNDAKIIAEGWDVYEIQREWRAWLTEAPRDPEKAYLGFVKKWVERRGPAR